MTKTTLTPLLAAALQLAMACDARADKPKQRGAASGTSAPAGKSASSAVETKAEGVLKAQLAALRHWSDSKAIDATFSSAAAVLFPDGERTFAEGWDAGPSIASLNPHSTLREATYDHFVASTTGQISWFATDLHFVIANAEPGEGTTTDKHMVRAIEVLDPTADGKVIVAAFTSVGPLNASGSCMIRDSTPAGPLVNLLASPGDAGNVLAGDAVVLGTDPAERGIAAEAKTLIGRWKTLNLTVDTAQHAREIHTPSFGYAMTNVKLAPKKAGGHAQAMSAFVLALPVGDHWSVVALSYGATF